jgi:hypothetical protein
MVLLLLTIYLNCSGDETVMALTIICLTGPGGTGKTSIIRKFTAKHLKFKYTRATGDVLGIFPMPRLDYAVGVNGSGDNLRHVQEGLEFLACYDGLRVMIVATRSKEKPSKRYEALRRKKRPRFAAFVQSGSPANVKGMPLSTRRSQRSWAICPLNRDARCNSFFGVPLPPSRGTSRHWRHWASCHRPSSQNLRRS